MKWLAENLSTFILCIILTAAVVGVIWKMVRDRRKGCSSCGCGCSGCVMKDDCKAENKKR